MLRKECYLKVSIYVENEEYCSTGCHCMEPLGRGFGCVLNYCNHGVEPLEDSGNGYLLRTNFCKNLKEVLT